MAYPFSRLEVSIQAASGDGLYYGRFPHGDAPASGASMTGAALTRITAVAALQTQIKLGGAAADTISASAALTTSSGGGGGALAFVGGNTQTLSNAKVGSFFTPTALQGTGGAGGGYVFTKLTDNTTCRWVIVNPDGSFGTCWPVAPETQTITVQLSDGINTPVVGTFTIPTVSRTGFVPNFSAMTPFASGSANTAAYTALNVPAMLAGTSYTDPVTGLTVWKVTQGNATVGATFPGTATPSGTKSWGWCSEYSALGLQISQAWGASLNTYTIFILSAGSGGGFLVDYTLGGTFSNSRAAPAGEGDICFSRLPGEAQILYYTTATKLNRYNTATNALANTGSYPYTWATAGGTGANWLQFNRLGTWATATRFGSPQANNFTGLKIGNTPDSPVADGTVRQFIQAGAINEGASGYGNVAQVVIGAGTTAWTYNLDTNVITPYSTGAFTSATHQGSLPGFWAWYDSNTGGGTMASLKISDAGVFTHANLIGAYYGSMHNSGHWTQSASASSLYTLTSFWLKGNPASDNSHLYYNNCFIDTNSTGTGGIFTLCGHYSFGTNDGNIGYRPQPHATISDDGLLALFSSCMFLGSDATPGLEVEMFLVEVPRH